MIRLSNCHGGDAVLDVETIRSEAGRRAAIGGDQSQTLVDRSIVDDREGLVVRAVQHGDRAARSDYIDAVLDPADRSATAQRVNRDRQGRGIEAKRLDGLGFGVVGQDGREVHHSADPRGHGGRKIAAPPVAGGVDRRRRVVLQIHARGNDAVVDDGPYGTRVNSDQDARAVASEVVVGGRGQYAPGTDPKTNWAVADRVAVDGSRVVFGNIDACDRRVADIVVLDRRGTPGDLHTIIAITENVVINEHAVAGIVHKNPCADAGRWRRAVNLRNLVARNSRVIHSLHEDTPGGGASDHVVRHRQIRVHPARIPYLALAGDYHPGPADFVAGNRDVRDRAHPRFAKIPEQLAGEVDRVNGVISELIVRDQCINQPLVGVDALA